ncbi:MAG: MOSC domain-containing protein [Actinomycetota bacterium]
MTPDPGAPEAQVLSVNVGRVREIRYRGKTHRTAIYKKPVPGRLHIAAESLAGDQQADHRYHGGPAKALYAYASEDYAWWQDRLGVELAPGTFGENLTLGGLPISHTLRGECFRVGTAVLRVTQPRFPCWKLGVRMGDHRFPREFLRSGRSGAYLAIVTEGDVAAGDPVETVSRPDHPVTIGLLAYLNDRDPKLGGYLLKVAEMPLEAEAWRELLEGAGIPFELYREWAARPA